MQNVALPCIKYIFNITHIVLIITNKVISISDFEIWLVSVILSFNCILQAGGGMISYITLILRIHVFFVIVYSMNIDIPEYIFKPFMKTHYVLFTKEYSNNYDSKTLRKYNHKITIHNF